jgi:hypothetical protein
VDVAPYLDLTDAQIGAELRCVAGRLLLRGRIATLLARREIGLLFIAFARHHPRDRSMFEAFALHTVDMDYAYARRHMQLAANWDRVIAALERLQDQATAAGRAFVIPGLRKILALAGVSGKRGDGGTRPIEEPLPIAAPPPSDVETLRRMVHELRAENRELRGRVTALTAEASYERLRAMLALEDAASLRKKIRHKTNLS